MATPTDIECILKMDLPPSARKKIKVMDFSLCILCQEQRKKCTLVTSKCFEKVLECIKKRAEWNDTEYLNISARIGNLTPEDLKVRNASWHSDCYKKCTHKANMERSKGLYEKQLCEPQTSTSGSGEVVEEQPRMYTTRSRIPMYDKKNCFFCNREGTARNKLHTVATDSAGIRLKSAVEQLGEDSLKVRLSDCTDPGDPHAKDIAYHKACWNKNVVNVLRPKPTPRGVTQYESTSCQGTNAEFLSSISDFLQEGNVTTMGEIENFYRRIATDNGLDKYQMKSRKQLKLYLEEQLECLGVVFSNPKRPNEPQRVSLKVTADVALSKEEERFEDVEYNMKTLLETAQILRVAILNHEKWKFTGSFEDTNLEEIIPQEVSIFYKWCCQGQINMKSSSEKRDNNMNKKIKKLSQILMYEILSPRQACNTSASTIRHTRELPLQVAVGLTIHSATRSKFIIQFLHKIGASIDYAKVLRFETQIATEVVKRIDNSGGVYVPPELVHGRFIFCAADNIDFLEDTPYGKGTLHGTVMVVYQEKEDSDAPNSTRISGPSSHRSLHRVPHSLSEILPCNIPKGCRPQNPVKNSVSECEERNRRVLDIYKNEDLLWMMAQIFPLKDYQDTLDDELLDTACIPPEENETGHSEKDSKILNTVPSWSAFNSIINKPNIAETRVCVLLLIDSSPTNTDTQLTFMKKLEKITCSVTPGAKTIVTLDLGLYRSVLKLSMAKKDISENWILRPDPSRKVRQEGNRCTYIFEARTFQKLLSTFQGEDSRDINSSHGDMVKILEDLDVLTKLEAFEIRESQVKPTLRIAIQYCRMVDTMLLFIRSVRTANWDLHLASLEEFVKYFFGLDLINYASMIAWYLADMKQLEVREPEVWREFSKGNWVVNKTKVPFCSLGTDEALEQENRSMKVLGGVVNITQRKPALTRFFLASPELSRLAKEAKEMLGITDQKRSKHHHLTPYKAMRQKEDAQKIYNSIMSMTNPVTYEGKELINISTKAVFDGKIENDTSILSEKGCEMYNKFKEERIQSMTCSLWAPMKKEKLKLCNKACKVIKTKVSETIIQLKADRSLFTRLLIISRSRTDMNLKECLSKYEFSAVPRSMFNLDGTMILTSNKSKLMKILEDKQHSNSDNSSQVPSPVTEETLSVSEQMQTTSFSVAVLDGMAELQTLHKPSNVKTCFDLAVEFNKKIEHYLLKYDETHLVFDTYLENSLKNSMRIKRAGNATPIEYKITDSTDIKRVALKSLLSHYKTKDELTAYLAHKTILYAQTIGRNLVVSWRNEAKSSEGKDVHELENTQEEADTKIILHCLYIASRASTLHIYSPDTDVFLLLLWWSEYFPADSIFVTGVGTRRRFIELKRVCSSLGTAKVKALLGLHALSGCDITGSLKNRGKLSFWKAFETTEEDVVEALGRLGCVEKFEAEYEEIIERFICQVYSPAKKFSDIGQLRWFLFTKKEVQNENLPPTKSSLAEHILRTHYQVMEWRSANLQNPNLPDPTQFGWELSENKYSPTMSKLPCAPESVMQLVRCGCDKGRCAMNCRCESQGIRCTEICKCGGDEETCDNNEYCNDGVAFSDSEDDT